MQEIIQVQIRVWNRGASEGNQCQGGLGQTQGGTCIVSANPLYLVDLIKDQQGIGLDKGDQILQNTAGQLIVDQNQI